MMVALLAVMFVGQDPGVKLEPLKFDVAALKAGKLIELKVTEDGATVTYKGLPLRDLLTPVLEEKTDQQARHELAAAVLLMEAADDYRAAYSAVAVAMDKEGERYFLAFEKNGRPLPVNSGPAQVIIPKDPHRVRCVMMVTGAYLVRLAKPASK